jgi:hypothetical protein
MNRTSRSPDIALAAQVETRTAPAGWLEALDRSEAELARGETVPLEPVLNLMRASIARMDAKRATNPKT